MATKERLIQFDLLKLFAIYLIIWGHSIGLQHIDTIDNYIFRILYSFHVALFMTISGFFSISSMSIPFSQLLKKKFMQLIYPCFIWGGIILIITIIADFESVTFHYFFTNFWIDLYWYSNYWFLKSCFFCYCIAYIGFSNHNHSRIRIVVSIIIGLIIEPHMFPCFILGMTLRRHPSYLSVLSKYKYAIFFIFILMLFLLSKDVWIKSHGLFPTGSISFGYIAEVTFYHSFRLVLSMVGSISFIVLFYTINHTILHFPIFQRLSEWGLYTLEIYIIHTTIYERLLISDLFVNNLDISQHLPPPLFSFFILILCIYIIKAIYCSDILSKFLFARTIIHNKTDIIHHY